MTEECTVDRKEQASWQGDVYGGITAAIVALPLAFGVAAFSILGPEYVSLVEMTLDQRFPGGVVLKYLH